MGSTQTVTILGSSMIAAPANGYAYIYVSNESRNPVFIDNFQVLHRPGRIVQDVSYYPFGLVQAGISSSAANGSPTNRYKYNGKEEQRQEFSNGSGLEMYEYKYRFYDHQIGRFISQDALADKYPHYTPYQFAGNQVPNAIDLDGLEEFRVNQSTVDPNQMDVTLVRVDAPFSVQYNGQKLSAFPQQNMNDYYQNNTIVKSEVDGNGNNRVSSVTTYEDGQQVNTFFDNQEGSKEIAKDQHFGTFDKQAELPIKNVTSQGTVGATLLQSNNIEQNSSNQLSVGIPNATDLLSFNASSMGSQNPATFTITNTNSDGTSTGVGPYVITGGTGVGNPAMISVVPGSYLNITVTPGADGGKYKFDFKVNNTTIINDQKPPLK